MDVLLFSMGSKVFGHGLQSTGSCPAAFHKLCAHRLESDFRTDGDETVLDKMLRYPMESHQFPYCPPQLPL